LNNGGIGPGMPEIPESPMFNMKPNALIYGARYDKVMEAFGGKGFFVEDPKDLRGALDEAMNFRGPALVNIVISQGSARKPQPFRWPRGFSDRSSLLWYLRSRLGRPRSDFVPWHHSDLPACPLFRPFGG